MKTRLSCLSSRCVRFAAAILLLASAPLHAAIDLNDNGLSDLWELLNEDAVDPNADSDGDGQSNLQESIFGTDPMSSSDSFHPPTLRWNATTGEIEVSWPTVAGKQYQLQTRADLGAGDWQDDEAAMPGTGVALTVHRPAASLSRLYLRVKVSDVDTDGDSLTNWEEITLGLNPDDRTNGSGTPGGLPPPPVDPNVVVVRPAIPFASEDGPTDGQVVFRRSGDTNSLMIGYTVSGTATRGVDHTAFNAWFLLPAGVHSKTVDIDVIADSILEAGESATVTISWVLSMRPSGTLSVLPGSPNRASVIISNSTATLGTGLLAEYFDSASSIYANSANFDPAQLKITRVDPTVDFDWLQGTPNGNTQLASPDNYSVAWEGFLSPSSANSYTFQINADDRARVFLDLNGNGTFDLPGEQILENGWDTAATGAFKPSASIPLVVPAAPANRYRIRVEFVETTGNATCLFQWRAGPAAFVNISSANVFTNNTGAGNGWNGSYYNDTTFTSLAGSQINPAVTDGNNGTWGAGTPDAALIHRDSFSVRWTGQVQPQFSEDYTLIVNCDDSAKLWVNGQPLTLLRADNNAVIDWPTSTTFDRYVRLPMLAGVRYDIRLEMFENTSSAKAQLAWYSPSQPRQVIPQNRLYPANAPQQQSQATTPSNAFALVGGPFLIPIAVSNGATISISGRPSWMNFSGGVLSGTPPAGAAGEYQIMITSTTAAGVGTSTVVLKVEDNTVNPIAREYWSGVAGTAVSNIPTAVAPTGSSTLTALEAATDFGEDYGVRIRGFLTAPTTGNYYFWIAANDTAELWISNDSDTVNSFKRAAVTTGSVTPRDWNAAAGRKSPLIALEAGKKYYIEALHKAGTGAGDNLAVGWLKPGETGTVPSEVVPGYALSVYVPPAPGSNPGTLYVATMLSQNGAATKGVGTSTFRLSEDENSAIVSFTYRGLTDILTDWHVHNDAYLTHQSSIMYDPNMPPVDSGPEPGDNPPTVTTHKWTIPSMVGGKSKADIVELIKQGKAYINIHTAMFPAGEIRGNFTLANGSQTFSPPPPPPSWPDDSANPAAAARFLIQATYGPGTADIQALNTVSVGPWANRYEAWIEDQFTKPASLQLPEVLDRELSDAGGGAIFEEALTFNAWWRNSVAGDDQLRQRVAFALSQIHVVSAQGPLDNRAESLSHFYDALAVNAFGNFRDLLETTTLTVAMGRYLDVLRNDKPDQSLGRIPNENYAREIMQLFSIGLFRKWPDGTLMLNSQDSPIDTYSQREIVGLSHVFTGWDYGYDGAVRTSFNAPVDWKRLMRAVPARHYTGPKRILNNEVLPGLTTAGGQSLDAYATHSTTQINDSTYQALPTQEMDAAHDQLFNHPNTGPYICRQLIQRLVTSHPSRDYIYRVVQKFNDNGSGVRGEMKPVIKAILLDYEARSVGTNSASVKPAYGKQREALLRITAPARAFRQPTISGTYSQTGTHVITFTAGTSSPALKLAGGNSVFLDFPHGAFVPGDTTPTAQAYTVLTTPAPTATSFAVNAKGWIGVSTTNGTTNGGVTGAYVQTAGSTSLRVNLGGHWLPAGGSVWLDFGNVTTGTAVGDNIYTAVTSDSTTGGGSFFTVAGPDNTARTGFVRIVGFRGSYTVTNSGLAAPQERRITFDTTNWPNSSEISDHHLVAGNEVFANFTAGNPMPLDARLTVESVPDANTFTVLTTLAGAGGGANDSDNGMWMFPLVAQPTTRSGAVNSLPSTYNMGNTTSDLDQSPLNSPTVFNFFLPDFKFPGTLASQGLTTPEFQDTAETTVVRQSNFILNGLFNPANTNGISSFKGGTNALVLDLSYWMGTPQANPGLSGVAAPQPTQAWTSNANLATLISELSLILNAGQVAASVRGSIRDFLFKPITAMTGSNPVTITSATHKLRSDVLSVPVPDRVTINGVTGGTFTNGIYTVTVTGANTFTIATTRTGTQVLTNAFCSPVAYDNATPTETHRRDRLRSILHLITTSPDYTIQR